MYTGGSDGNDAIVSPVGTISQDEVSEIRKTIQALEIAMPPQYQPVVDNRPLGYLNVTDYGVNGTATDAANMALAIADAIQLKKKLYAPQMIIDMGTTTLEFPNTVPPGFTFQCDPGCAIVYSGTSDAITINSAGFCAFRFGIIFGSGGANAIHINPALPNAEIGGQTATVGCEIEFNTILGFRCGIYADNNTGNVAQNNIYGLVIITGQGGVAPASMTGTLYGIKADGRVGGVYQGNKWDINYIEMDASSLDPSAIWIGIQDGDATIGTDNNVNTYQYGAIDAIGWGASYGVNSFGNRNVFIGPIVDIHICFQLGSTAYFLYILAGSLSTMGVPGDYEIFDGSASTAWHWTWLGASDGRTGNIVSGTPAPLKTPYVVCNPSALPALGGTPTVIPMTIVASGGTGLTASGGGIRVATSGTYSIKGNCFITAPGASYMQIGIAINGVGTIVAMNTTTETTAGMSTGADVYATAGDIIYLGAVSTAGGAVTAGAMNSLSVIGPL